MGGARRSFFTPCFQRQERPDLFPENGWFGKMRSDGKRFPRFFPRMPGGLIATTSRLSSYAVPSLITFASSPPIANTRPMFRNRRQGRRSHWHTECSGPHVLSMRDEVGIGRDGLCPRAGGGHAAMASPGHSVPARAGGRTACALSGVRSVLRHYGLMTRPGTWLASAYRLVIS